MSHYAYSPVGYDYRAEHYCLDCIPKLLGGHPRSLAAGFRAKECNCAECRLDRIAADRGIDRMDERSFDMDDFPKHIPYFNDLHCECEPPSEDYPNGSCGARCGACGVVIDGTDTLNEGTICVVLDNYRSRLD